MSNHEGYVLSSDMLYGWVTSTVVSAIFFLHSFIYSFTYSFINSLIHLFIHSCMRSFIYLSIHCICLSIVELHSQQTHIFKDGILVISPWSSSPPPGGISRQKRSTMSATTNSDWPTPAHNNTTPEKANTKAPDRCTNHNYRTVLNNINYNYRNVLTECTEMLCFHNDTK